MSDELAFASLNEIRARLARREVSARELVDAQLERIERLDGRLNAFITVCAEEARESARRADETAAQGELLPPLLGVPISLKDILWTRGVRTTSGSKLHADFVPGENAAAVDRLLSAGAIVLGKTNLHELAYGVTSGNPHYGAVRNPWDLERIPGGSSGGSGAALAAGMGYGSIGTDTGGSIRIPSAFCGGVGLKPTYGRVSRYGVTPLSWSLDHVGPMARTVEDAALLYEILAGPDERDRSSDSRPVEPASPQLGELPAGLRLGLHESYFFENLDPEVESAVRRAAEALEGLGLVLKPVSIPEIELQATCRNVVAFVEASAYHRQHIEERPEAFGEDVREHLRLGLLVKGTDYVDAQRARARIVRAFHAAFEGVDVLLTPATPAPAPRIGEELLSNGEPVRLGLLRLAGPFNTVGFPAIALPCGFTRAGLPIGLQLAARPFEEALLLRVAHAYERSQSFTERHPKL